jgi:hydrogenase/urease accessory protein HupE
MLKDILKSTNGTVQIILAAVLLLAVLLGFPEQPLLVLITAIIGFVGVFREWIAKGLKFNFSGNWPTYLAAFLVMVLPTLAEAWDLLPGLIEAIKSGNLNQIITAGILLFNVLAKWWNSRKEEQPAS